MPPVFWDVDHQILLQQHMAWIFFEGSEINLFEMAQASQRVWLFCFTLGQEAEEWNLLLLQAKQLGENWFFVCFSGLKWHLTGDHCINPQLTPHFLRGSNDARSYPNNKTICQRSFKFTQKFQGIQKSNMFARKSIVVVFFRTNGMLEVQQRLTKTEVVSTVASQEPRKAHVFRCRRCFNFSNDFRNLQEIRFVPFVFIFKKLIKLTLRFKFKSVFFVVGISLPCHIDIFTASTKLSNRKLLSDSLVPQEADVMSFLQGDQAQPLTWGGDRLSVLPRWRCFFFDFWHTARLTNFQTSSLLLLRESESFQKDLPYWTTTRQPYLKSSEKRQIPECPQNASIFWGPFPLKFGLGILVSKSHSDALI